MRGLFVFLSVFLLGIGQASAVSPTKIKASIDHDEPPTTVAESIKAFVEDLRKFDGKIVELDLSIASATGNEQTDYEARTRNGK